MNAQRILSNTIKSIAVAFILISASFAQDGADHSFAAEHRASSNSNPKVIKAALIQQYLDPKKLFLRSSSALIMDVREDVILYGKNSTQQMPIASLTKLMTAMVVLDAKLPLDETIRISKADRDRLRGSKSRLAYGTLLTRNDLLLIALAASENRAAAALARTYPGGKNAFVRAMNEKAGALGMPRTRFKDPTGLNSGNVSTAVDLSTMVQAAYQYPLIRDMTTTAKSSVTDLRSGWEIEFFNTNRLVRKDSWNIELSKTGYISDSGYCLVMHTEIHDRPLIVVLLNSWGKLSKFGDAIRIKKWLIKTERKILQSKGGLSVSQG
jgi:D-alanyl-D-alanine endopeptidase (penicillin-binding protein 7)